MSAVAAALREEGGLLAGALAPVDGDDPLAAGLPAERAFSVAAVREGWRLHGGAPPAVVTRAEPDLALLGGDRLYALGLERLAAAGDVEAVAVLAGAIAACARAAAEQDLSTAEAAWADAAARLRPRA